MSYEAQQEEERRLAGLLEDAKTKIVEVENSPIFSWTREHTVGRLSGAVLILDETIKELRGWV